MRLGKRPYHLLRYIKLNKCFSLTVQMIINVTSVSKDNFLVMITQSCITAQNNMGVGKLVKCPKFVKKKTETFEDAFF